jgi:hypothetical protein
MVFLFRRCHALACACACLHVVSLTLYFSVAIATQCTDSD